MDTYHVIGVMSGTSLDGVDIAYCRFDLVAAQWKFEILAAQTYAYTAPWTERLRDACNSDGMSLSQLHADYGHFLGELVNDFIHDHAIVPDFIASHGHTIFHQPGNRMTLQIGSGAALAAETGMPVVSDFRSIDVACGGQGAPLVPIGDKMLFAEYWYCLNLGGFANISFQQGNERIAYDICPVNFVMNMLASRLGYAYDAEGRLARAGQIDRKLLSQLNALVYYVLPPPKSLGREWVHQHIVPLVDPASGSPRDLLRTFTEHVAVQVTSALDQDPSHPVIITWGGAYNEFLMERIRAVSKNPIIIPNNQIVEYKEALIFAFLGVLRMRNETNCLRSVTGASKDSCGGAVYWAAVGG